MQASGYVRLLLGAYLVALSGTAISQDAFTVQAADVYAGPDDSYPLVAQLDPDSPLQVMGCLDDWSWCDVAFGDDHGWVYAPAVIYEYQGGFVPLYTYAPSLDIPVVQFTVINYWDRYYRGRPWYGHREEWVHREPPHHHMPPGPRPSASPPPLSARVERPSHESRSFREGGREHPLRLGSARSAEQPPREEPRQEEPRHEESRREEPRHEPAMPSHAEPTPPHAEPTPHVGPPGESPPRHEPPGGPSHREPGTEPSHREQATPGRAEPEHAARPERHEGRSNEEQAKERPKDEPH